MLTQLVFTPPHASITSIIMNSFTDYNRGLKIGEYYDSCYLIDIENNKNMWILSVIEKQKCLKILTKEEINHFFKMLKNFHEDLKIYQNKYVELYTRLELEYQDTI